MKVRLIVMSGAPTAEFRLRLPTVIGRSPEANLKVKHHHVSRRHCELFEDNGRLVVCDLGSANGTVVNGQSICQELVLSPGDELTLGSVRLRVEFEPPSTDSCAAAVTAVEDPPLLEPSRQGSARVSYAESEDGSFVGIEFRERAVQLVDDEISLDFPATFTEDISRIDLHLDDATDAPADDDSGLDNFLRGLPDP